MPADSISRHRTAIHRSELSRPVRLALADSIISPETESWTTIAATETTLPDSESWASYAAAGTSFTGSSPPELPPMERRG